MEQPFKNPSIQAETVNLKEEMIYNFESTEFKEVLKDLEAFSGIGLQDKLIIFATVLHFKPASEFTSRASQDETEQLLIRLRLMFQRAGKNELTGGDNYVIGTTVENVAEAMVAYPGYKDHVRFGNAMGFPKSAVDAFDEEITNGGHTLLQQYDYWEALTEEQRKFLFFALSKDHYTEELEWLNAIIRALEGAMPMVYSAIRYKV